MTPLKWELVYLKRTPPPWFELRIRLHWSERGKIGRQSNLSLGLCRERFARGSALKRFCTIAPEMAEAVFDWWDRARIEGRELPPL